MSKRFTQFAAPAKPSVLNHGSKTIVPILESLVLKFAPKNLGLFFLVF
jgi:hypothetical protein